MTELGSPYFHVVGTGQLKATRGVLKRIVLNGLGTVGTCTVYDGLDNTGAVIAILTLDIATSISVQPIPFEYNARLNTGLYLEYGAGLVADLTVMAE